MKKWNTIRANLLQWRSIMLGACVTCASVSSCSQGQYLGTDIISGVPIGIVPSQGSRSGGMHTTPELGMSCEVGDADHLCLGLKYLVYSDSSGNPVVSRDAVANNITAIDMIWSQCNIGFQIDRFVVADPRNYGLSLEPSESGELNRIRSVFSDSSLLLLVTTGRWNRSGTLGNTSANAWTNMPGSFVLGVVMEQPVGGYANIIAHELGHYLNLGHVSNTANVMNPVIYTNSTQISADQCDSARIAAKYWWSKMLRM